LVHGSEINTTNLKQVMQKLVYLQRKIEWIMERIPIFPLSAVVFPGEYFNLHIFEPRYKQLIQDVELGKTTFGIPYIDNKTPGEKVAVASPWDVPIDPFEIVADCPLSVTTIFPEYPLSRLTLRITEVA
jgi:hypothetical protein